MKRLAAATLGLAILTFALTSCTGPVSVGPTKTVTTQKPATQNPADQKPVTLTDPLSQLKSADSGFPQLQYHPPVIHASGVGRSTFGLERPSEPSTGVTFFVTCSPAGQFTVTMGTFYSGGCIPNAVISSGGIPVTPGPTPLTVTVDVPAGATFWLVGIPTENVSTTN